MSKYAFHASLAALLIASTLDSAGNIVSNDNKGVTIGGPLAMPAGPPRLRPELGLGDPAEPEILPSAIGLVWRALILWLLVILLVTLANLAP